MAILWKVVAAVVGGLIFSFLGAMVVTLPMPAGTKESIGWVFWLFWAIAISIVWLAATPAKAWRRLLLMCGLLCLMLPISTFLMTGVLSAEVAQQGGNHAAGATAGTIIGGGIATVLTGVISFFMAAIFLISGLLIGKDKPVNAI